MANPHHAAICLFGVRQCQTPSGMEGYQSPPSPSNTEGPADSSTEIRDTGTVTMKLFFRIICLIIGHRWVWQHVLRRTPMGWEGTHGPCGRCGKEEGPL